MTTRFRIEAIAEMNDLAKAKVAFKFLKNKLDEQRQYISSGIVRIYLVEHETEEITDAKLIFALKV